MNSRYPDIIEIEGETLKYMKDHSELIRQILEIEGNEESLELSSDILFGGDKAMWKVFLDLFFPEEAYGKLFDLRNSKLVVKNERGGEDAVMDVLRYMMVDEPGIEIEFAKKQAAKQINAEQETVERGVGIRAPPRRLEVARNNYFYNEGENNNGWNNNNNGSENNVRLGYTENEEAMLGKLKGKNAKQYYPNERRKSNRRRSTRKQRKNRRSTRKQRR